MIYANKNYAFIIPDLDGDYEKLLMNLDYLSLIKDSYVAKKIPFKKIDKKSKTILNKDVYFFILPNVLTEDNKKIFLKPILNKLKEFSTVEENIIFQELKKKLVENNITIFNKVNIDF